jgi:hypothetical protein
MNRSNRRNKSEIAFTEMFRSNEIKENKDSFLESFSGETSHKRVDTLILNEDIEIGQNKNFIKTISSKFHELYLKLVTQIKSLKLENKKLNNILKNKGIDDLSTMRTGKNIFNFQKAAKIWKMKAKP